MKKVIYFIMFVLGFGILASLYFLPIYQFDADLAYLNNTDYYIYATLDGDIYTDYENYVLTTDDDKKAFEAQYNVYANKVFAAMNADKEVYYNSNKLEVAKAVYLQLENVQSSLNEQSTEDAIDTVMSDLKERKGEDAYNAAFNNIIETQLNAKKLAIDNYLRTKCTSYLPTDYASKTTEEQTTLALAAMKEVSKDAAVAEVCKYILCNINDMNSEDSKEVIQAVSKDGIKFMDIVDAWITVVAVYKTCLEANPSADLITKVTTCLAAYNPVALVVISLVLLLFIIFALNMIFGGIKGMIGVKRPKLLIKTALMAVIGAFLILFTKVFSPSDLINCCGIELHFLSKMFIVGGYDFAILVTSVCFAVGFVISLLGLFCKWGVVKVEE